MVCGRVESSALDRLTSCIFGASSSQSPVVVIHSSRAKGCRFGLTEFPTAPFNIEVKSNDNERAAEELINRT